MASLKVRTKITNFCEGSCWYCSSDERNNHVVSKELYTYIIKKMRMIYDSGDFKRAKFGLTGGNPFSTSRILDATIIINDIFKDVKRYIVTDLCISADLDLVKEYLKLEGLCMLSLNEDPLDEIVDIFLKIGRRSFFLFNVLLTNYNMERMDQIIDVAIKHSMPLRLNHLFDPQAKMADIKEQIKCVRKVYERLSNSDFKYNVFNYPFGCIHRLKHFAPSYCGYGENYYYIDTWGNVRRCQMEKQIASITDENLEEKIKYKIILPDDCKTCEYFSVCKGGCPYSNKYNKYCALQKETCKYINTWS